MRMSKREHRDPSRSCGKAHVASRMKEGRWVWRHRQGIGPAKAREGLWDLILPVAAAVILLEGDHGPKEE